MLVKNKECKCGKIIWNCSDSCKSCWSRGRKATKETIEKQKLAANKRWENASYRLKFSLSQKERYKKYNHPMLGRKHKDSTLVILSEKRKLYMSNIDQYGEKNPAWKGGRTKEYALIRTSKEYDMWRKSVFERDRYICQICHEISKGNLHAHHIKEFSKYPELRMVLDNGLTLCIDCHQKVHNKKMVRSMRELKI